MMMTTSFRRTTIAFSALAFIACGSKVTVENNDGGVSAGGGGTSTTSSSSTGVAGPYDACEAATDCAWGEIDHEILVPSDCVCLFGCPYIPLSKATVDRRNMQYKNLCTPGQDGQGQPCAVDDCAGPGKIVCESSHCVAAPAQ